MIPLRLLVLSLVVCAVPVLVLGALPESGPDRRIVPGQMDAREDAQLLERFVGTGDEMAFELLVWRHRRLVMAVCRRVLRDYHDAEDAFQATFLTLARKASSISRRECLATWLYQVSYRIALRAKKPAAVGAGN